MYFPHITLFIFWYSSEYQCWSHWSVSQTSFWYFNLFICLPISSVCSLKTLVILYFTSKIFFLMLFFKVSFFSCFLTLISVDFLLLIVGLYWLLSIVGLSFDFFFFQLVVYISYSFFNVFNVFIGLCRYIHYFLRLVFQVG